LLTENIGSIHIIVGDFKFLILSPKIRTLNPITLFFSRTGSYFFPTAGKSNQKEPPLKDKKLKTESVWLPDSYRDQTPPSGRQTGNFF
jgi:hypothetical protein